MRTLLEIIEICRKFDLSLFLDHFLGALVELNCKVTKFKKNYQIVTKACKSPTPNPVLLFIPSNSTVLAMSMCANDPLNPVASRFFSMNHPAHELGASLFFVGALTKSACSDLNDF